MAEEENNEEKAAEGAPEATADAPKKKLPLLAIGLIVQSVVVLVCVVMVAKSVFMAPKVQLSKESLGERVIASIRDTQENIKYIGIKDLVSNMDSEHTIKAQLVLELSDEKILKIFESRMPIIRSRVIRILSQQTFDRLDRIQGKLELKDKLIQVLNDELAQANYEGIGTVRDVYFTDLLLI